MRFWQALRSLDWVATAAAGLLICLGLAMLFSSTYTTPQAFTARFTKQLIVALMSLGGYFFIARVPYHTWRRFAPFFYSLGVAGLIFVALTASVIRGAASRLVIFGVQIQPSEFMRILLIVGLAYAFCYTQRLNGKFITISCILVGLPILLIGLEPDFGMAALLAAIWLAMLVFLGLSWRALAALGIIMVVGLAGAWQSLAEYQQQRLITFLDPARDPLGAGYNINQSIVALGSGYLFGRGLGHGPQSRLNFLPERHTDFIFASIGEELGFAGILLVITLYSILLWRIIRIAHLTQDLFGELLAVGAFFVLFIGFTVSAGMNMGLLPVTGIPLPLVSYGGSNLMSTMLLLGIVQSVYVHSKWVQAPPPEISQVT